MRGVVFTASGGTLDGVTANGDLDLATNNAANVHIVNGLTLDNATVRLGNAAGTTYGQMYFDSTETLGGTGTVLLGKSGNNVIECRGRRQHVDDWSGDHGAGQQRDVGLSVVVSGTIVNQGTIARTTAAGPAASPTTRASAAVRRQLRPTPSTPGGEQPGTGVVYQTYRYQRLVNRFVQLRPGKPDAGGELHGAAALCRAVVQRMRGSGSST